MHRTRNACKSNHRLEYILQCPQNVNAAAVSRSGSRVIQAGTTVDGTPLLIQESGLFGGLFGSSRR